MRKSFAAATSHMDKLAKEGTELNVCSKKDSCPLGKPFDSRGGIDNA